MKNRTLFKSSILFFLIFSLGLTSCQNKNDGKSDGNDSSSLIIDDSSFGNDSSEGSSSEQTDLPIGYSLKDSTSYKGKNQYIKNFTGSYYSGINKNLEGTELQKQLYTLLTSTAKHKGYTYNNLLNSTFPYTDAYDYENIGNKSSVTSFYSGRKASTGSMNREHVWPNSRGGNYIDSDPHMTRPTITTENSKRENDFFNEDGNFDPAYFSNPKYRGIAARIIFYCAVKGMNYNLRIVDKTNDTWNKSDPNQRTMGKLNDLLKWNIQYPVDDSERLRNNYLNEHDNWCRNPFIDDRNYACKIWGRTNSATMVTCGIKS